MKTPSMEDQQYEGAVDAFLDAMGDNAAPDVDFGALLVQQAENHGIFLTLGLHTEAERRFTDALASIVTPQECAHGRDYRTGNDDGTQTCACGAIVATDGKTIYHPDGTILR